MLQKLRSLSAFSAASQALREGKSPLLLDGLAAVHKAHFAAGFCQSLGKGALLLTADEAVATKAKDYMGLITPVLKAYLTDKGFHVASLAMQVHGGSGYTEHFPASQYLRERLQSSLLTPPSLDELAHECHMRKETLIRAFKQDTGLTPGSYLNIIRIDYARQRLRAGDVRGAFVLRPELT